MAVDIVLCWRNERGVHWGRRMNIGVAGNALDRIRLATVFTE